MTVFRIPNEIDAAYLDQAEPDSIDVEILVAGIGGTGVVTGCAVTAQGSPDMTVAVAAGVVRIGSVEVAVTAGNVTITTAHATNPRLDLVVVGSAGAKSVVAGTAAVNPVFPAIPALSVVLAAIYVPANDTTIATNQITGKGVPLEGTKATAFIGARAITNATFDLTNATEAAVPFAGTDDFDTDGFHDPASNNTRMTIPAGMGGKYLIGGFIAYTANTTGDRWVKVRKGGATDLSYQRQSSVDDAASATIVNISAVADLAAGEYVELFAYQDSGGATVDATSAAFWIVKLDSGKVGAGIGAKAYNAATQAISAGATVSLVLDAEEFDTDGFHSNVTNNERMTVPAGLSGKYLLTYHCHAPMDAGTNPQIAVWLRKNGAALRGSALGSSLDAAQDLEAWDAHGAVVADLVAGDYIDIQAFSVNAITFGHANAELQTTFSIMRLDSGGTTLNRAVEFVIDGAGSVITAGVKGYVEIPFACRITAVRLLADVSGSIVVDIWKDTYANYPPVDADSITASAVPTISAAIKSLDTTLTGWTTSVAAGDIVAFNVDSATTLTRVTVSLTVVPT